MRGLRSLLPGRSRGHGWKLMDARHEVDGEGCPPCRAGGSTEAQWVTFYAIENHGDLGVIARLRAARGFCAAHTRAVLTHPSAPTLLTSAFADLAGTLARDVDAGASADCPLCEVVRHAERLSIARLLAWWRDDEVRAALRGTGRLCWEHLADVLADCPAVLAATVLSDTAGADEVRDAGSPLAGVGGARPDHARREPLVRAIADELPEVPTDPLAELDRDAGRPSCPGCQAHGRAVVRLLHWLCRLPDEEVTRLDAFDLALCVDHLADLAALCPARAETIGRSRWRLLAAPLAGVTDPASLADHYRRNLLHCPACTSGEQALARRTALIAARLDDAEFRTALLASHGPCLPHAAVLRAHRPDPESSALVSALARTRVSTVAWLLEETARKQGWRRRHEPKGTETEAWKLAPTWITAHAYLGAPDGPARLITPREPPSGPGTNGAASDDERRSLARRAVDDR